MTDNIYLRQIAADKVLKQVMLELATRENNDNIGSGLGGNVSEFFFLLTHSINVVLTEKEKPKFIKTDSYLITLEVPASVSMKDIRLELSNFVSSHPDYKQISQEELRNPSFLKDLKLNCLNVDFLIKALESGIELSKWLDLKMKLANDISMVFCAEYLFIKENFIREKGLPNYFFSRDKYDSKQYHKHMNELYDHSVWGPKYKDIQSRHTKMEDQLLSQDDIERLQFIASFPSYITLFAARVCIGIERVVSLNLDERCDFMSKINSEIER